ncbi:MAG TPA: hypothetical protein VME20_00445 [Acidimicrobiales bacterium]|nr:hypothetical protein [Acidimicrobiales bacterium]
MSPAEPRRQARPGATSEERVDREFPYSPAPEPQGAPEPQRHLTLVRQVDRKRASRRHFLVAGTIASLAGVSMGLVGLHALIAENQFRLDNLQQQAATQQAQYEKLRLNVAQLESPSRIVSVAEGTLGMQQPGSVTYLPAIATQDGTGRNEPGDAGQSADPGGTVAAPQGTDGAGATTGSITTAPQGDADWPAIKPYLSGTP